MNAFEAGDLVKFAKPMDDFERKVVMEVVWCDRERTMVRVHIEGWEFQPTTIYQTADLTKAE